MTVEKAARPLCDTILEPERASELAREFFGGFAASALINLHLEVRYGENAHHMVEALFKAFARATSMAVRPDPRVVGVPSTKGTLTG